MCSTQAAAFDEVAAHYGLPTVSLWRAIREAVLRNESDFQLTSLYRECMHPAPLGHALIAQLLVSVVSRAVAARKATGELHVSCGAKNGTGPLPPLPAPFLKANKDHKPSAEAICTTAEGDLSDWVAGGNWRWVNEGGGTKEHHRRVGWVSSRVNTSAVHLCAPASRWGAGGGGGRGGTWNVAHLLSYTGQMGSVEASCSGGCSCTSQARYVDRWIVGYDALRDLHATMLRCDTRTVCDTGDARLANATARWIASHVVNGRNLQRRLHTCTHAVWR